MTMRLSIFASVLVWLASCAQFPDLDSALSENARTADYPNLVPVEVLQARVTETRISPETASGLQARVAALKARAARLRGSVIDSPTRERMSIGVEDI